MNTSKKQINYNFIVTLGICFILLTACKTKHKATDILDLNTNKTALNDYLKQIGEQDFNTVYFNSNINYSSTKENQNVSADIKIEYNKTIWISIKAMGFPVARALITPKEVKYYEKINRTFFEGDFNVLSDFLGTDVDFYKLQNLLLGRSIIDLKKNKPRETDAVYTNILENGYLLKTVFNATSNMVLEQSIFRANATNTFKTSYSAFINVENMPFPSQYALIAQTKGNTRIEIETKKITLNEPLRMSYNVPDNCKQIYIQ